MNAAQYAKDNLESCLGLLNACVGGMDDAQYNWKPGGTANIAAKSHVHAVTAVDFFINGIIRGDQAGLLWNEFAPKHGLPQNPMGIWTHEGAIAYAAMQEFAKEVQSKAVEFVASLKDEDFDREIETQFFGKKSVAFLVQLAGMHAVGHGGDIAAVKGIQGLKGLPF
jgi:hypothetical protein